MSTWDRFSAWLTEKKLGIVMIVLALIPMFIPIALPMSISPQTQDFYNEIVKRPAGEVVIISHDFNVPAPRASRTYVVSILDLLCKRGLRIMMLGFLQSYGGAASQAWDIYMKYVQPETKYGYVYGRDWVVFPLLAGEETAVASIGANLKLFSQDFYGNTLADLPIMQGISSMNDINLVIFSSGIFTFMDAYVRQWPTRYPHLRAITFYVHATVAPYYGKQVFGDLDGVRGYAEFEYITGFLGEELVKLTARNLLVGMVIATVIVGNVFFHLARSQKLRAPAPSSEVKGE